MSKNNNVDLDYPHNNEDQKKENKIVEFINNIINAFGKFFKSSYLSLFFLGIILLLVQALDQANTLLVDMIENDKVSLFGCYILIAFFASLLAHYPRYIFYAENINKSNGIHQWYAYRLWLGYRIFTFSKIEKVYDKKRYQEDFKAKYLRHSLGLVIFSIWHYYIYQAFYPNLVIHNFDIVKIKIVTVVLVVIPALILVVLLHKFDAYQTGIKDAKNAKNKAKEDGIKAKKKVFVKRGVKSLLVVFFIVIVASVFVLIQLKFNFLGYWLLQGITFLLALLYLLFRVYRVYVITVYFRLYHISNNVGYLRFYLVFTTVVLLFIIYSNFAVYYNTWLANAMLILLCCFFIVYYILACLLKYFFMLKIFKDQKEYLLNPQDKLETPKSYLYKSGVINKKNIVNLLPLDEHLKFSRKRKRIASLVTFIFLVLCVISYKSEQRIHELEIYKNQADSLVVSMANFKAKLKEEKRANKPLLFVAAHGGGLKANIWTMKVLNKIQMESKGTFLNQTVSFSGASGGMMGLSLYSVLSGRYINNFNAIDDKIEEIAKENFASRDIALTFGCDFVRKLFPFNKIGKYRDRSYYSLVTYRNILESKSSKKLDSLSFKAFWKENIFNTQSGHFPSLIINTAKTNGKRGVFYSLKYPDDETIFYNSDRLSQLNNGAIAFYEAVSSTNRFPGLSPAAKIKEYGHYIDAGAIDNSGLLSSLDLYVYLEKDSTLNKTKKVFVEIINGKSNYVRHLIEKFKEKNPKEHLIIDEIEQDNIIADLKTGLNLDKIPSYLSNYLKEWESNPMIDYKPVYLPFYVQLRDIEKALGGELIDEKQIKRLSNFLKNQNKILKDDLKDTKYQWDTYEPTLARHLSKSTIEYYNRVLKGRVVKNQINAINDIL